MQSLPEMRLAIFQFRFDENTGHFTANSPARVEPEEFLGPRHFCFHPSLDILYFSDEQRCRQPGIIQTLPQVLQATVRDFQGRSGGVWSH